MAIKDDLHMLSDGTLNGPLITRIDLDRHPKRDAVGSKRFNTEHRWGFKHRFSELLSRADFADRLLKNRPDFCQIAVVRNINIDDGHRPQLAEVANP